MNTSLPLDHPNCPYPPCRFRTHIPAEAVDLNTDHRAVILIHFCIWGEITAPEWVLTAPLWAQTQIMSGEPLLDINLCRQCKAREEPLPTYSPVQPQTPPRKEPRS